MQLSYKRFNESYLGRIQFTGNNNKKNRRNRGNIIKQLNSHDRNNKGVIRSIKNFHK